MSEQQTLKRLFAEITHAPLQTFPNRRERLNAPKRRGVYVIYTPRGNVAHVGMTPRAQEGIYQRLRDHMSGNSSFTIQHLKRKGSKLRGRYTYRCIVVKNRRHRALLEAYATGLLCPAHIGLG